MGDNAGLKRKRGAQKKLSDPGIEATSHKELENDLTDDKEQRGGNLSGGVEAHLPSKSGKVIHAKPRSTGVGKKKTPAAAA